MHLDEIADLEAQRRAALAEQNGPAYARLCDELGVPAEDEFLYERGFTASFVHFTRTVPPVFGFTKVGLGKFPYSALKKIFFGMHAIDLQPEMMTELNPSEILAKLYGAEFARVRRVSFTAAGFTALVRFLDGIAYRQSDFRAGALKLPAPYPTTPGAQQKRLAAVDEAAKERFVQSFLAPPRGFYDPNNDGRDPRLYVHRIYDHLNAAYKELQATRASSS